MNTRYLTLLSVLVLLGFTVSTFAKGKPGTGGGGTYTATLSAGYFEFASGTLTGLASGRKGKSLSGNVTLEMDYAAANDIFLKHCSALLPPTGVMAFDVLDKDWSISYTKSRRNPDQIHLTMNNLIILSGTPPNYDPVDFDLHLHGEIANGDDFLPASGSTVDHQLTRYKLWGGGQGDNGWFICNSDGGGMESWEVLPKPSTSTLTLTITAVP